MTIRLNKVTRDLNVGISTVVEFLQKKGFAVEANPNTKINEEQYALLVKEFSTDKNLRLESERFIQERQNKDRNKASVSIDGYEAETTEKPKVEEIKTVVPEDARPKFKPVGKIDLDKLNRKPVVEKVEEKKVETSAPVVKEEPKPQPKPEPKPEFRPEPKPEPRPELKPEPSSGSRTGSCGERRTEAGSRCRKTCTQTRSGSSERSSEKRNTCSRGTCPGRGETGCGRRSACKEW